MEANGGNMELDMMLMPNFVGKPVESQYPGGPGTVLSIPSKIDPKRKDAALKLIDFLTTDTSDTEAVKLNGGAVPVNANVQPADGPGYRKEKEGNPQMGTYLDWVWRPEITRSCR